MLTNFDALCKTLDLDSSTPSNQSLSKLIHWYETTVSTDQHVEGDLSECFTTYKELASDFLEHIQPNILTDNLTAPVPAFKGLSSLQLIVDKGLDVYLKELKPTPEQINSKTSYTLLQLAAARGHLHTTERLLSLGAEPQEKTPNGNSILFNALILPTVYNKTMKENKQAIYALLSKYCKTDERNDSGESILHIMSIYGYETLLQEILTQAKPLAFIPDNLMHYPVHSAILNGRHDCVQLLLAVDGMGALTDEKGRNALHYAAEYGNEEMVNICLKSIPKDSVDGQNRTPLILATIAHNNVAVAKLIDDALVNMTDSDDKSALHYAVESNNVEAVKLLLAVPSVVVNISDYESHTPFDLIKENTPAGDEIKKLLLARGAIPGDNISKASYKNM